MESVKWELEHLGQDGNNQLDDLFGNKKTNDEATKWYLKAGSFKKAEFINVEILSY